jgi:FKBP-type peptidyl-prolyl cis-trans isomerase SlyD
MSTDTVQDGKVVSMDYTLRVDGEVLDSSEGQQPLEFLAGRGNIIPGLEREMMGMKIGESKDIVVPPAEGYGDFNEEDYMDIERKEFPKDMPMEEGIEMHVTDSDGLERYARIDSIEGDLVRLNFNHPLAGMELDFKVKVVGVREPTTEELEHGHVHNGGHQH